MLKRLNREPAVSDLIQLSEGMWVKKTAFLTVTTSFFKVSCFPTKSEDFILVPEFTGAVWC